MSNQKIINDHDGIPRFEPWLGVMASSFVPAAVGIFVPAAFLVPLIALTALLFGASLVMLWRQSRTGRSTGNARHAQNMEAS